MKAIVVLSFLLAGTCGYAQNPCASYDAGYGTLPSAQGWTEGSVAPFSHSVAGGVLHQSTLPFSSVACSSSTEPQRLNWQHADSLFNFDDGVVLEAEVWILSSQDGANPCNNWPRPGFSLAIRDASFRNAHVGLLSSKLMLFNDPFLTIGSPGYSEVPFDTTDGFHVYRLEVDAAGMTLFVDGNAMLSQPHAAPASSGSLALVGDGTIWANSEAQIRSMRFFANSPWCDRGFATAGTHGDPLFAGTGDLTPNSPVALSLTNALENRLAFLIIGFADLTAPFLGGVLVPVPNVILSGLPTNATGQLNLSGTWSGVPAGAAIYWQFLISDPVGPSGFSFSNALLSIAQ